MLRDEPPIVPDASRLDASRPDASSLDAPDPGGPPSPADEATRERGEIQDRLLRVTAEFDNFRKRTERERRELWDTASADVIRDILPAIDDFERAIDASAGQRGADALRRGIELTHRQLIDILKKRGVTVINAVGQMFDPHVHEAVAYEPADGRPDGEVTAELRRGYKLGERLLRAAAVRVAKG
jgi:molecular chaperone GrpE